MQDIFVVQAIFAISMLIIEVPSGYISDKLGHKKAVLLGYASDVLSLPSALIISAGLFLIIGTIPLLLLHKHDAL